MPAGAPKARSSHPEKGSLTGQRPSDKSVSENPRLSGTPGFHAESAPGTAPTQPLSNAVPLQQQVMRQEPEPGPTISHPGQGSRRLTSPRRQQRKPPAAGPRTRRAPDCIPAAHAETSIISSCAHLGTCPWDRGVSLAPSAQLSHAWSLSNTRTLRQQREGHVLVRPSE